MLAYMYVLNFAFFCYKFLIQDKMPAITCTARAAKLSFPSLLVLMNNTALFVYAVSCLVFTQLVAWLSMLACMHVLHFCFFLLEIFNL